METHISCLFPELLAMIFGYLDVRDKGLQARGIRRVQILSLRRSLSYVIQGMANIESLNLSGCYNLTDNGLGHAFVQEIGSLRALNLSLCKQITDSSLGRIAQYLKGLRCWSGGLQQTSPIPAFAHRLGAAAPQEPNLRSCRHLSRTWASGTWRHDAERCRGLLGRAGAAHPADCQKLTDLSLKHISRGLTASGSSTSVLRRHLGRGPSAPVAHGQPAQPQPALLRQHQRHGHHALAMGSLRLSGLDVDDGINRMVRQMHGLRTLNIGQCVRITDKGLELIAEHLSQLTGIDLYGCTRITKRGLDAHHAAALPQGT
ncbi:hypothetical protein U0070_021308 [Myodes glareolus]|uniref:Receptor-type protein kinase n=1 Tax=Myodes glareolus TaxID=447135 RepID=A0AAW0JH66_MYOGA